MDYKYLAVGHFEPRKDRDAAMKFGLNVVLMDHRLESLQQLVTPGSRIGGMGGEPGWEIDRVLSADRSSILGFEAKVDPDVYELGHPEGSYDAASFWALLRPMLMAYRKANPESAPVVDRILALAV